MPHCHSSSIGIAKMFHLEEGGHIACDLVCLHPNYYAVESWGGGGGVPPV